MSVSVCVFACVYIRILCDSFVALLWLVVARIFNHFFDSFCDFLIFSSSHTSSTEPSSLENIEECVEENVSDYMEEEPCEAQELGYEKAGTRDRFPPHFYYADDIGNDSAVFSGGFATSPDIQKDY